MAAAGEASPESSDLPVGVNLQNTHPAQADLIPVLDDCFGDSDPQILNEVIKGIQHFVLNTYTCQEVFGGPVDNQSSLAQKAAMPAVQLSIVIVAQ
ncbi:MAG: hypothetical protein FRX49_02956 [Trebouxia sp. A1-2]|nr:MAG: hypothetical protein FRX49_02956 [Trebouxia sp. A1-2]